MMQFTAFFSAILVSTAVAFSPATLSTSRTSTLLNAERSASMPFMNRPALLDGSMAGDVGFDPLGLSEIDGVGIDLYWLREAELKHGRVAMLAVTGFIFVEVHGPAPGCEEATAKNQIDAFWQLWNAHPQYIVAGLIFIGIVEMISGIAATSGRESGQRAPGDFGVDPLSIKGTAKWDKYATNEVLNGRLAMWAAAGEIMQGCTTPDGALGNLNVFN